MAIREPYNGPGTPERTDLAGDETGVSTISENGLNSGWKCADGGRIRGRDGR